MTRSSGLVVGVVVLMLAASMAWGQGELKVIQSPTFWIVGQWTRIMIETPADCGELEISHPPELTLLDRWPWQAGDTTQRFYFRAQAPLEAGEIVWASGDYRLSWPVRVLSWEEVLTERFEREITPGWDWTGVLDLPRLFPMEGEDEHKSGLSFLTPEELERQRAEFERNYRSGAEAEIAMAEDLEEIFYDLPESALPRAVYVNNTVYQDLPHPEKGCPVCGERIFEGRSAFYPWVIDPDGHPFQVQ